MADYGRIAVNVAKLWAKNKSLNARKAWFDECKKAGYTDSVADKGCPRDTFFGLCEKGRVKGIEKGNYTKSILNKKYALKAVACLAKNPDLAKVPVRLWEAVGNTDKSHNQQMHVVVALWDEGLIVLED